MKIKNLRGRKLITCDVSYNGLYSSSNIENEIADLLPKCLNQHKKNVSDFEYLEKIYAGEHDILKKTRVDETNDINNIVVENHCNKINNFKVGFTVGRPIEYSYKGSESADDMSYFNRYLKDSNKSSLDTTLYSDIYLNGIGHRMIIAKRNDFNQEYESPFEIINLDNKNCFVAHSSGVEKQILFGCIITKEYLKNTKNNTNVYTIYLNDGTYFELNQDFKIKTPLTKQSINFMPIVECCLNEKRIGVIETIYPLQHAINNIDSMEIDDIEQFISSYLVFENQEINEDFYDNLKRLKKERALSVKTTNPNTPAKVSLLSASLNHTDINTLYDRLISAMYDISSTPKASGSVTSGGDTTGARLLGNGWESALNQAELDTSYMINFEYQQLKMIFEICNYQPNSFLNDLYPSEIEIKYNINMSNNLLVKTQSLQNLRALNMPYEIALNMVGLTGFSHEVAIEWRNEDLRNKEINNENQN